MVNEKAKNPSIPALDGTRRSSSLETVHHRGRKRSLSAMSSSTKGLLNQQTMTREESDANRLLSKHSIPKPLSSTRQSQSARLVKLIPDLSQKEMSRLVGAIIRRQKRDASSVERKPATTRDRTLPSSAPALFPEKDSDLHAVRRTRLRCLLDQQFQRSRMLSRCYGDQELGWTKQRFLNCDQYRSTRTGYIATWI